MGSLFKSKTTTSKAPFQNNPWGPQEEYLLSGFNHARSALQNGASDFYRDQVADLNTPQINIANSGMALGRLGTGLGTNQIDQGRNLSGYLYGAGGALNKLDRLGQGIGQIGNASANTQNTFADGASGIGDQMASLGSRANSEAHDAGNLLQLMAAKNADSGSAEATAASGFARGISDLSDFYAGSLNGNIGATDAISRGIIARSNDFIGNGDVSGILSDATRISDNPHLQSQIDAAIGDVNRGFQETQAQINSNASGAGGMNSTRAAVMESKALEAAQRNAAQISAGMRSDAYNTGLNTALSNKSQNAGLLNTQLSAGQQQMGLNDQRINVAGQDLSTRLNANQQYMQGAQMGQATRNDAFMQTAQGLDTSLGGYDAALAGLDGNLSAKTGAGSMANAAGSTALAGATGAFDALSSNNQYRGSLGQFGTELARGGYETASGADQNQFDWASIFQQQRQNEIDGRRENATGLMDFVNQYMSAVGGNYGSYGYGSQVAKSASPFQQVAGAAASIFGGLKGF